MNNLKKFSTEADYSAATLNYPAVSWVTATDNVHFDKTAPVVVNDKVMMAWHSPSDEPSGKDIVLWNGGASIEPELLFVSLTLNDVDVMNIASQAGTLNNYSTPDTDYLAKYELIDDSAITDIFSGDLGGGWGSDAGSVDFLIPSQVTEIQNLPQNVLNVVVEAATPPTISVEWSDFVGDIYVPDNAVSVYQTAWSDASSSIYPISEYQGNLPV
ncbi:hypothetical protein [uncultured Methanobrevibacter sp.]|uniref:hypothetical protein n=1 Tax=uncultured Methanobrevibacter sp. TaxID=253161 RepID=UPI0025D2CDC6|nr:hypothetical protein [uncultured Methanobrevibacter sp.]